MGRRFVTRIGRYWIFFVIVAVGLALSWGQVGTKTRRVLLQDPLIYLNTEADCRPRVAPCAALGSDRALVLGPAQTGLLARRTGLIVNDVDNAEVILLGADGNELGRRVLLADAGEWRLTDIPDATRTLRFRIAMPGASTVAEFPIGDLATGR